MLMPKNKLTTQRMMNSMMNRKVIPIAKTRQKTKASLSNGLIHPTKHRVKSLAIRTF